MSTRQSSFAYVALLVGVITFAASFVRPTSGQQAAPNPPIVGRYAVAAAGTSASSHVFVTDTTTGKTWYRYSTNDQWEDWGSPIPGK